MYLNINKCICIPSYTQKNKIDIRDINLDYFSIIALKYKLIVLNFGFCFEYFGLGLKCVGFGSKFRLMRFFPFWSGFRLNLIRIHEFESDCSQPDHKRKKINLIKLLE